LKIIAVTIEAHLIQNIFMGIS